MAAVVRNALAAHVEERNPDRTVDVTSRAAHHLRVAGLKQQLIEPSIVTEANPHDEVGAPELAEIPGPWLERFSIACGWDERFDTDQILADRDRELREVGSGCDNPGIGRRRSGDEQYCQRYGNRA
jgi:hypothetical protein